MTALPVNCGIIWLDDGRAGHRRQCRALLDALRRQSAITLHHYHLPPRPGWQYLHPGPWLLDGPLRDLLVNRSEPLMVLAAGRRAAAVSLATVRLAPQAFRVQLLDPKRGRAAFPVLIVPAHDRLQGHNVLTMHGSLHDYGPAKLPEWRQAASRLQSLPGPRYGLLLGGHGGQNRALLEVAARAIQSQGSMLVSLAPRTGAGTVLLSREGLEHHARVRVFKPHETLQQNGYKASGYEAVLAWADVFLAAGDSINQLNELLAVRGQRPIRVAGQGLGSRHRRYLNSLRERSLVQPLEAFGEPPAQRLENIPPDTEAIAAKVLARWRTRRGTEQ